MSVRDQGSCDKWRHRGDTGVRYRGHRPLPYSEDDENIAISVSLFSDTRRWRTSTLWKWFVSVLNYGIIRELYSFCSVSGFQFSPSVQAPQKLTDHSAVKFPGYLIQPAPAPPPLHYPSHPLHHPKPSHPTHPLHHHHDRPQQ